MIDEVRVEEVTGKYFLLRSGDFCVTYYMKGFIFTLCSRRDTQLFTLEDEENVDPRKVYRSVEEFDEQEYNEQLTREGTLY